MRGLVWVSHMCSVSVCVGDEELSLSLAEEDASASRVEYTSP